jgi:hypothetical protein
MWMLRTVNQRVPTACGSQSSALQQISWLITSIISRLTRRSEQTRDAKLTKSCHVMISHSSKCFVILRRWIGRFKRPLHWNHVHICRIIWSQQTLREKELQETWLIPGLVQMHYVKQPLCLLGLQLLRQYRNLFLTFRGRSITIRMIQKWHHLPVLRHGNPLKPMSGSYCHMEHRPGCFKIQRK